MHLDEALKSVAVIGAAGKMGSGIALLLLQEMARSEAEKTGSVGKGEYCLYAIDVNDHAQVGLRHYLSAQMLRYAEKNINLLRQYYAANPTLISNAEIIDAFVKGALDLVHFDTEIFKAKDAFLVFEAIVEEINAKTILFTTLRTTHRQEQYYFTNTSSIPISLLDSSCRLDKHIIGFHFYNPPAVQKLIELVTPENTDPALHKMALELAQRLDKKIVNAHDIAGFIGNGYLMREIVFACEQAKKLSKEEAIPLSKAIYFINRMTQEYLLRPMGIFQLIDFIGIDVCWNIAKIMSLYLPDPSLLDDVVEMMVNAKVLGGQYADGTQKSGFFQYERHALTGSYAMKERRYYRLSELGWEGEWHSFFGELPDRTLSWKTLQNDPRKHEKIQNHLHWLLSANTKVTLLAQNYLMYTKKIAQKLVDDGIADQLEDVDIVLQYGFLHPYGTKQI